VEQVNQGQRAIVELRKVHATPQVNFIEKNQMRTQVAGKLKRTSTDTSEYESDITKTKHSSAKV
jgi:hypothetical protein